MPDKLFMAFKPNPHYPEFYRNSLPDLRIYLLYPIAKKESQRISTIEISLLKDVTRTIHSTTVEIDAIVI